MDNRLETGEVQAVSEKGQVEILRGENGQFLPGKSPNPGGRPKQTEEEKDALEEIRSRKFSKSYNHSFWGYSNMLTGAVNLSTEKVITNRAGAELEKYFRKLFAALKK